ncbi:MAG: hypothetical protein ACOCVR_04720 [Myxococcota bacterium]
MKPTSPLALVSLSLALLVALPVSAFVLPLPALLDQLRQRREESVEIPVVFEGKLTLGREEGERFVVTARRSVLPEGVCRLEILDGAPEMEGAFVIWDGRQARDSGHDGLAHLVTLESIACPLLAAGSHAPVRIEEVMDRLGVDRSFTGYSRLDGRVAFLVGGRPWEERPQVWIDKDEMVPVRAIAQVDAGMADVRLLRYGDPITGRWYPRTIEVRVNERLVASFTAESLDTQVELSASLFR